MKKLVLSVFAAALTLGASAEATWQLGPYAYTADTLFHSTTGPGMTTTGVRLSSSTKSNVSNIFYTTIDLTNPNLELRGVQAKDDPDKSENVLSMGNRKNTQGKGQYLAGVNGDFFNMGAAITKPCGHAIVDGKLYNVSNDATWDTWGSYVTVNGAKDVFIDMGVKAVQALKFPDGNTHKYYVNPGGRWDNYLCIYTPAFGENTGTNQWGRECTMKLVSGSIEARDAVFEITSEWVGDCSGKPDEHGKMPIPEDGYVLSGVGTAYALMAQLKPGDKVSLGSSVTYNGNPIEPTQSIGGCSMIVIDGKIAPSEYFSSSIINHFSSDQARTVVGYNRDRTQLIIMVCDKYKDNTDDYTTTNAEKKTYGGSTGMVLQRMGHIMLHLGCYTAMNFDGGGSSQLYNKELGIRNVPYGDDYLRSVSNGFFAVETTPVDNEVAMLEVYQKNVKLASGEKFTPKVFGYNKYGVLVDKNVTDFTFTVAPSLGSVSGTTFTAGDAKGSTHAVVAKGNIKCAVRILTNGGGVYTTSGDDEAPLEIKAPYTPDEAMGIDKEPLKLIARHQFVTTEYNDGYDGTAPNWDSPDAIKAKSCVRFATGRNGVLYTLDMKTMSIAEITWDGQLKPLYKLPKLDGEIEVKGKKVKDYYGVAISTDDYGNFLIGHYFTQTATYRVFTIYSPKSGKAKTFELPLPTNGSNANGRIDNVGRVVGDLTNEAYVYVAPVATGNEADNIVNIIHFLNPSKDGDVNKVDATNEFSKTVYLAGSGNNLSICQPKYKTVAEMKGKDINETFYWYSKAGGLGQWNQDLFCFENGTYSTNYCNSWNNYSRLNGFDTFMMNGRRYFVVAFSGEGDTNGNSNQHIIVKNENSETVAEWNNEDWTSSSGYNSITAVPVNDNHVNIYVYNCDGQHIGGALLTLVNGDYEEYTPVDITPEGLVFDNYEDGATFKITASPASAGAWSNPAYTYRDKNPGAFAENKQLTVLLSRGNKTPLTQEDIDTKHQVSTKVRDLKEGGKCLVINTADAPGANLKWESSSATISNPQYSFFLDPSKFKTETDKRHYVRVRIVFNTLFRGCHYNTLAGHATTVKSIYATHDGNWVVPALDAELGSRTPVTGIDFAKWVNETNNAENIPDEPKVYIPNDDDVDPWDADHHANGASQDHNGKPQYLMNSERFRVYEFDTYAELPNTISVQYNTNDGYTTHIIKEIKFTDLGTDEANATLLGRRKLGWNYYSIKPTGIDDIVVDENMEGIDEPAEYYNLQGVRIANPENGIYIVRRGNKVSKEFVR